MHNLSVFATVGVVFAVWVRRRFHQARRCCQRTAFCLHHNRIQYRWALPLADALLRLLRLQSVDLRPTPAIMHAASALADAIEHPSPPNMVELLATRLELLLSDAGVPTFYKDPQNMPIDQDVLIKVLSSRVTGCPASPVPVLSPISNNTGIINAVYIVEVGGRPTFVVKVLPLLPMWRQRKCENEVCAMVLARSVCPQSVAVVPEVVCFESNAHNTPLLREFLVMTFCPGENLAGSECAQWGDSHPARQAVDSRVSAALACFSACKHAAPGHFRLSRPRITKPAAVITPNDIELGPELEDRVHDQAATSLPQFLARSLAFRARSASRWVDRARISPRSRQAFDGVLAQAEARVSELLRLQPDAVVCGTADVSVALDHFDLHDGNVLVALRYHTKSTAVVGVEGVTIIDFEWAFANVTGYSDNSVWDLTTQSGRCFYTMVHCLRWDDEEYEDVASTQETQIAKLTVLLHRLENAIQTVQLSEIK